MFKAALRTLLLLAALAAVLWVTMAMVRSRIVPIGMAREDQFRATLQELEQSVRDSVRTAEEIDQIIRALCRDYPELQELEECRGQAQGSSNEGR